MESGGDCRLNGAMFTVRHLVESFDAHCKVLGQTGQQSAATREWYRWQLAKLTSAVGTMPADTVRTHHLVSIKFTYHFVRALKSIYRWAADEELIPKDPFRKMKTPRCGQRTRTLKRPEMARLYRASADPRFRRFLMFMVHTIARPGEIRLLRWRDIRLPERLIVLKEFKAKDKRKDGQSVRLIPLDLPLARMLGNMQRKRDPQPDDFIFRDRYGKEWSANAVRCHMRKARRIAGLESSSEERVVCYTLRHTGATEATRRGVRDNALARMMGHTSTRTTARYQHLEGHDLVDIVDGLRTRRPAPGGEGE